MAKFPNKILALALSTIITIHEIIKFLPEIIKEFIILILVISFTWEYRKMLRRTYLKFIDNLLPTFILIAYSILSILSYSYIKFYEAEETFLILLLIVTPPTFSLLIYGYKYFKKNFKELEVFYRNFFNKKDYKKFWHEYHLSRGIKRKVNDIIIYSIPGLFAGFAAVVLFATLLVLIFTSYLFLIATIILIIKDFIIRKKIFIADSAQKSLAFLEYLINIKGTFSSLLLLIGYFSLGIYLINLTNTLLSIIILNSDIDLKLKSLITIVNIPFFPLLTYMLIFQYRLSRRFPIFLKKFYLKEKLKTFSYPSLPYGSDKAYILSFIILVIIILYTRFIWGHLFDDPYLLIFVLISSIIMSIFYLILIIITIFNTNKKDIKDATFSALKRDNFRLPFVSTTSSFPLFLQMFLWSGDGYLFLLYIYMIASVVSLFFYEDFIEKLEQSHINEYIKETIPFLFYFIIAGIPMYLFPRLYLVFISVEIFIAFMWCFIILNKMKEMRGHF